MAKKKIVVIGNGMAGARVVEEILQRAPEQFEIVMFGAEPYGNYNRIALSNVLNQSQQPEEIFLNPLSWYSEKNIHLHRGVKVFHIDRAGKVVRGRHLTEGQKAYEIHQEEQIDSPTVEESYDQLIIATGSRPTIPAIEGYGGQGCFVFRTIEDCRHMASYAARCHKAVVFGGGILGLEAVRGLLTHRLDVTIIESAPQLMPAQLDTEAAAILLHSLQAMGMHVRTGVRAVRIQSGPGKVVSIDLSDGNRVPADMIVASVGIRPVVELAERAGLAVRRGIVCDDRLQTSDPDIFALGECIEHEGKLYGLVEPIWEQARVLADVITAANPQAEYRGSRPAVRLKVMGINLMSLGEKESADPSDELIVYRDPHRRVYKKLIIRGDKIQGAILLGDIDSAGVLMRIYASDGELPSNHSELLFGSLTGASLLNVKDLPDHAQICNCSGVSKKTILEAVDAGCSSVSAVGDRTHAGKGCGSCKGLIAQLIESRLGNVAYDPRENYYVPGVPLEKSRLVAEIKARHLVSVSAVFRELAGGHEDPDSKMGLASLLKILWPSEYQDERDSRFINDRVHANIQKDGTFSVVPRMYAGVTTPDELIRIAQVAQKYKVRMVKITGGQRIDLLGVRKEDLPAVWRDLKMPSGHAYTKTVRTCKSCVGTEFCRFGLGDSILLAQELEHRYQGIETPHKVKMGTTGCPRNCSEAYIKDIGVVAVEGGRWEIYVGGAAGSIVRKGDLLCVVETHEQVLQKVGIFLQYYREHARYLERTHGFVSRIGIEVLKEVLVQDSLGICSLLEDRIQEAVDAYRDPWKEGEQKCYPSQFEGPSLVEWVRDAENNG